MPENHSTPTDDPKRSSGRRSATPIVRLGVVAVSFTLIGMLIATQMDFTAPSVASPPLSNATTTLAPVGSNGGSSPFVPVIERVSDAVVSVSGDRYEQNWFGGGMRKSKSSGTGFFFRPDGYVLTNNHVVDGAEGIEVTTAAGFQYDARLVGLDPATDLAVLKVDTDDHIAHIPFGDSDSIRVGQWAIAIGNPFPQQGLFGSVTVGVISALGRAGLNFGGESPDYQNYIQVDASINPGNSGGPLLDINGEAIGVNSAISSPTGASVGIGFAVPINIARAIIPDLIAYGEVKRGWLGVSMGMVTPADARRLQLDQVKGVVVERVIGNSPAESAGLRVDDIIYEYNGHEVSNPSQFSILVSMTRQGESAEIKVIRDRERLTLNATVTDRKSGQLVAREWQAEQAAPQTFQWMGMELMTLTRSMAAAADLEYQPGVVVVGVVSRSPAFRASIERGYVITEVNDTPVSNLDDFKLAVNKIGDRMRTIPLIVVDRQGDTDYRTIRQ